MTDEPRTLSVLDPEAWPTAAPRCVEVVVPDWGSTWAHAYTLADWDRIRMIAAAMGGVPVGEDPGRTAMRLAQLAYVCRTGPGSPTRTFTIPTGGEQEAYGALAGRLPWMWVEQVCAESDRVSVAGYRPSGSDHEARESARRSLRDALADPAIWMALEVLSLRLYGLPLTDNGEPLGHVLAAFEAHQEAQDGLVSVLGALHGL